ncbi:spermidine synthase family protein [Marinimicrococcus flavescens]|uniref:Uncharacterized protein n=1 Tax=Marinimicrococcus flavescens TaxID=3031815 RepID=A0AAP3XPY0_9PROT|nr:hypothetical protein [Marinimicrococcus flavescens]
MRRTDLALAYGLLFISGMPALAYQVVWQRVLTLYFGVDVYSTAIAVAVFMLGLGLGSLLGGRLADRVRRPGLLYALAELLTRLYGLASLHLMALAGRSQAGAGPFGHGGAALAAGLGLAAMSGLVALGFQITAYRLLVILLKGSAYTFGTLLFVFLSGIALGSLLWRGAASPAAALRRFALSQLAIALWLLALALLLADGAGLPGLRHLLTASFFITYRPDPALLAGEINLVTVYSALDIFFWSVLFLAVPTLAMGVGFPALIRAGSASLARLGTRWAASTSPTSLARAPARCWSASGCSTASAARSPCRRWWCWRRPAPLWRCCGPGRGQGGRWPLCWRSSCWRCWPSRKRASCCAPCIWPACRASSSPSPRPAPASWRCAARIGC